MGSKKMFPVLLYFKDIFSIGGNTLLQLQDIDFESNCTSDIELPMTFQHGHLHDYLGRMLACTSPGLTCFLFSEHSGWEGLTVPTLETDLDVESVKIPGLGIYFMASDGTGFLLKNTDGYFRSLPTFTSPREGACFVQVPDGKMAMIGGVGAEVSCHDSPIVYGL